MIIGIDIRMLAQGTRSGIEEYTINLLSNMISLDNNIEYKLFYNGYKKTELEYDFLKLSNVQLKEFKIPNRILDASFQFLNYPKIDKMLEKVDVFFSPHIFSSSLSKKCRTITTFHDLSFESYPEFYSTGKNYWHFLMNPRKQARKADQIIAVSKSTKDDLINIYNIKPEKIKVIYSGIDQESRIKNQESRISKIKKRYNLPDRYILYLGTLEPRKNIIGLIKAFEILNSRFKIPDSKFQLIIAGSKGWLYNDIFKTVENSPVKNDIVFTGFVDNKDKSALYSLADLFVYPSFYEGFGFPPLEAMAAGTPVVTSNFSSLPEAVGDAAIMVNPYNLDELAKGMEMVLTDEKLKNILIERGLEQIKKFSWQKCARETLKFMLNNREVF
ncbi:MAG: glycosyltransferase family 4 protein [Candidatus Pacebacteria bacterium]|nr:glycosyltransferase family 4 protein [Candidatus Paceibacterota bacterium]